MVCKNELWYVYLWVYLSYFRTQKKTQLLTGYWKITLWVLSAVSQYAKNFDTSRFTSIFQLIYETFTTSSNSLHHWYMISLSGINTQTLHFNGPALIRSNLSLPTHRMRSIWPLAIVLVDFDHLFGESFGEQREPVHVRAGLCGIMT